MKKLILAIMLLSALAYGKTLVVNEENALAIGDEINMPLAHSIELNVLEQQSKGLKTLDVFIDSPGGSIIDGMTIADLFANSGMNVRCYVRGMAASMAAIILQYCNERYASPSAVILFHNASTTMEGEVPTLTSRLNFVNNLVNLADKHVAKRLGLNYGDFLAKQQNEWWLVGAEEAKKANVIDDVASVKFVYHKPNPRTTPNFDELQDLFKQLAPKPAPTEEIRKPAYIDTIHSLK